MQNWKDWLQVIASIWLISGGLYLWYATETNSELRKATERLKTRVHFLELEYEDMTDRLEALEKQKVKTPEPEPEVETPEVKTSAPKPQKQKSQRYNVDGSHKLVKKAVIKAMHKPETFKHVSTTDHGVTLHTIGSYLQIRMKFTGENEFGESILMECEAFPYTDESGFYGYPDIDLFQTIHPKNPKYAFKRETWNNMGIRP